MSLATGPSDSPSRSVASVSELSGIGTASLADGDQAYVASTDTFWYLLKGSSATISSDVRATQESSAGTRPGRWIRLDADFGEIVYGTGFVLQNSDDESVISDLLYEGTTTSATPLVVTTIALGANDVTSVVVMAKAKRSGATGSFTVTVTRSYESNGSGTLTRIDVSVDPTPASASATGLAFTVSDSGAVTVTGASGQTWNWMIYIGQFGI